MRRVIRALVLALLVVGAPARAAWLRATSAHFVIYADTQEARLREQAVELERVDALLRFFHRTEENAAAAFNKVTIYVVPSLATIQRLSRDRGAAGFYVPRVTGSVAFTPRMAGGGDKNDINPRIVLLHEYAHHFMLGNYAVAYPAWFSEGYAEFVSTVMRKEGAYWLGAAANHRAYGLVLGRGLTARQLFDPPARMTAEQRDALYGRGWLLTHLVTFDQKRRGQHAKYLELLNDGTPSLESAQRAFGDLGELDRELERYLNQGRLTALRVPEEKLGNPQVTIAPLSPGEAAMIALRMESTAGVDAKTAPPLYRRALPVAARFPADPVAQGWFAEIALDAGELDAAEKAADAGIAADPGSSQALLYKARVLMVRALKEKAAGEAPWKEARRYIVRANRAQNDDAAALQLFYQSFQLQGAAPTDSAKHGLYRALQLVPQDGGLRFAAVRQLILDGEAEAARRVLRPLAADPHRGGDNPAARLLAALDAGKTGQAALDAMEEPEAPAAPAH